jgi:multisubunit Na+/H+ antiporter MnhE subunit
MSATPPTPSIDSYLREGREVAPRLRPAVVIWLPLFILRFTRELVMANLIMARTVLFERNSELRPDFITYDVRGLRTWEVVILTHTITLTPGTTSVHLDEEETTLVVHALDARDPDGVRRTIKDGLERPLLRRTR